MLSPFRTVETDGVGAELMPVVCAWCSVKMGAKVCEPAMAGKVSHGICPACFEFLMTETRAGRQPDRPTFSRN